MLRNSLYARKPRSSEAQETVRKEEIGKLAGNSRRKPKGTPETIRGITNNKKRERHKNKNKGSRRRGVGKTTTVWGIGKR